VVASTTPSGLRDFERLIFISSALAASSAASINDAFVGDASKSEHRASIFAPNEEV
jgi:hypothetical protein